MSIDRITPATPRVEVGPVRARVSNPPAPAEPAESRSLWEMLTPAERDFFARVESLGPLTYKPGATGAPRAADGPAPTGQRVDVKG